MSRPPVPGSGAAPPPHLPEVEKYLAPRVDQSYARALWSVARARRLLRAIGPGAFLERLFYHPGLPWIRYVGKPLSAAGRRLTGRTRFQWRGSTFEYPPWPVHGERRVEIPIARGFLAAHRARGMRVLEIGNVLHEEASELWLVVDKYEKGPAIVHTDVVDFVPPVQFEIVLAISTLEHVGFDEDQMDLGKFQRAVDHLYRTCLSPGGWMLVTVPLGYHPEVDLTLLGSHLGWGEVDVLRHASWLGDWREVPVERVAREGPPMYPYARHRAEAVAVWTIHKPALA